MNLVVCFAMNLVVHSFALLLNQAVFPRSSISPKYQLPLINTAFFICSATATSRRWFTAQAIFMITVTHLQTVLPNYSHPLIPPLHPLSPPTYLLLHPIPITFSSSPSHPFCILHSLPAYHCFYHQYSHSPSYFVAFYYPNSSLYFFSSTFLSSRTLFDDRRSSTHTPHTSTFNPFLVQSRNPLVFATISSTFFSYFPTLTCAFSFTSELCRRLLIPTPSRMISWDAGDLVKGWVCSWYWTGVASWLAHPMERFTVLGRGSLARCLPVLF